MDPVLCDSCGIRFPADQLGDDAVEALRSQHRHEELAKELRMLQRVQDFYRRHPDMEGRIKPHVDRILESDEPCVMDQVASGVPFGEIALPSPSLPDFSPEDRETVEYLQQHGFVLGPRLSFVSRRLEELKNTYCKVRCPTCRVGHLRVDAALWDQFAAVQATSWLWPEWHYRDEDGTLHIKASGCSLDTHWTGEQEVRATHPDFEFLSWLVSQKEHHRLIDEKELATIRQAWSRARQNRNGGSSV
jgi:hypothetical protein